MLILLLANLKEHKVSSSIQYFAMFQVLSGEKQSLRFSFFYLLSLRTNLLPNETAGVQKLTLASCFDYTRTMAKANASYGRLKVP